MRLAPALRLAAAALLAWPALAHADPVTFFALVLQGASVAAAAVAAVAIGLYSADARRRQRHALADAKAAYNASLEDRNVTALSAAPAWQIVYGRCVCGGDIVAILTSDKTGYTNGWLPGTRVRPDGLKHLVIVVAAHEVQAINEVYVDGVALGALDGNGRPTSGEFYNAGKVYSGEITIAAGGNSVQPGVVTVLSAWDETLSSYTGDTINLVAGSYTLTVGNTQINNTGANPLRVSYTVPITESSITVKKHLGSTTQTYDTYLAGLCPTEWTESDRLRGLAYVVITLDLEDTRFQGGPPNFTFDVSGKLLYDTRTSTTAWSDNPALAIRDFLVGEYGYALATSDIDDTYTNAAANACDVTFPVVNMFAPYGWSGGFATPALLAVFKTMSALSWSGTNATVALSSAGYLTLTPTGADPSFNRGSLTIDGSTSTRIVARIKRVSGTGWDGIVYYSTGGHGHSGSYYKAIAEPTYGSDGWGEASWDMTALTAGGTDWTTNTITSIRMDLGNVVGDVFQVEYVTVTTASTFKTYTCNGVVITSASKESTLQDLEDCMAGQVTEGAQFLIQAGAWTASVATLNDDDLDGQIEVLQAATGMEEIFNTVRGKFIPGGSSVAADIDVYANTSYVTADGVALYKDVQFPFTDHKAKAKNLARIMVERNRSGMILRYPAKLKHWPLQIGERVTVNSTEYGLSSATFRITDWDFALEGAVVLTLQQDSAAVWDLADTPASEADRVSQLPNPATVSALASLAAASGTAELQRNGDGSIVTRVRVSWAAPTDAYIADGSGRIEITWRRQLVDTANTWQTVRVPGNELAAWLTGAVDGDYVTIGARAVNSRGVAGEWTYLSHQVVGKTAVPANVAGLAAAVVNGDTTISWTASTEADYARTELRRGASWAAGTLISVTPSNPFTWPYLAAATYTIWAKHFDTSGNESTTAQSTSAVVGAPGALGFLSQVDTPQIVSEAVTSLATAGVSGSGDTITTVSTYTSASKTVVTKTTTGGKVTLDFYVDTSFLQSIADSVHVEYISVVLTLTVDGANQAQTFSTYATWFPYAADGRIEWNASISATLLLASNPSAASHTFGIKIGFNFYDSLGGAVTTSGNATTNCYMIVTENKAS